MATKKTAYEAPTPASDKKKALQTALSQIDKSFGKGTVMRLGDRPEMNVEAIPTGSLALEFGDDQGDDVCAILVQNGYTILERSRDYNDRERAVLAQYGRKED